MNKIRPLFYSLSIGVALATLGMPPLIADAQSMMEQVPPLVVVRFNQPRVYFDKQLYGAVSQAVAAKPDVMFDVVSSAPSTGNPRVDENWIKTASRNTQAVVAMMQNIGVPMERMHISGQAEAGLKFDETRIYVR